MKVDVVMLGALSSHEQTGLYSLSQKICEVLYVVPVVLADVIYPRLGRASNPGSFPTESESQTFFDLAVGASILVAFAAVVLSRPLISGLFGEAYGPAVDIFQVHAFSCIGVAVAHVRFKLLAAAGMQKQALMVALCGLALAVVLNASLIPIAGAMGAAIATVISHFLAGYAAAVLWPELRHVTVLQTRSLWPWVRLMRMSKGVGSKGAVA
jgi:O-antigen/teichoic acid export membrane protein